MKTTKHNKKRNAFFLYECLIRELTKCVLEKQDERRNQVLGILKEFFQRGTMLSQELALYREILSVQSLEPKAAERFLSEVKRVYCSWDHSKLAGEQQKLNNTINKELGKPVFQHYVPNYRNLATIYQILNGFKLKIPQKSRIMLEEALISQLVEQKSAANTEKKDVPADKLVMRVFLKKFNETYGSSLLMEQKELLRNYILSPVDELEWKLYLNNEIFRLKEVISKSENLDEIRNDMEMVGKAKQVMGLLESYQQKSTCDGAMVEQLLKIQQLVRELESDAN